SQYFFNDRAPTEIYTLSLHDALPILPLQLLDRHPHVPDPRAQFGVLVVGVDRKSTRLNSSHLVISYVVFCLQKDIRSDSSPKLETAGGVDMAGNILDIVV